MLLVLFFVASYLNYLTKGLPSLEELETFEPYLTTEIISSEGEVIKEIHKGEKRILVPLKDIPENMINAIIATEDQRFFRHWGVDTYRVFGAAFEVIKSFSYKEGFSTITMQLTRQLHFNPEKKIVRKLREVLAAIQIEKRFSRLF